MSVLATTRVNLAPTVRTLASGVPLAPRINFAVGSSSSGHDDTEASSHGAISAVRGDAPPKWASVVGGSMMLTRQNGGSRRGAAEPSGARAGQSIRAGQQRARNRALWHLCCAV